MDKFDKFMHFIGQAPMIIVSLGFFALVVGLMVVGAHMAGFYTFLGGIGLGATYAILRVIQHFKNKKK